MRSICSIQSARPLARARLAARILGGGYAALAAFNAQAADLGAVAAAFGNTVVSTYPDGRSMKIWLRPDGRWEGVGRTGVALAGKWRLKKGKVCLRQAKPPTLPLAYCTPFPADSRPGVQWTGRDFGGTPIRLTLQKGAAAAPQGGP